MRNGNIFFSILFRYTCSSSYPTYEEWKQRIEFCGFVLCQGSYPTYEEWKLPLPIAVSVNIAGSYPTYEEWKRFQYSSFRKFLQVLILPMRNGNMDKNNAISNARKVLILPMRNGNFETVGK